MTGNRIPNTGDVGQVELPFNVTAAFGVDPTAILNALNKITGEISSEVDKKVKAGLAARPKDNSQAVEQHARALALSTKQLEQAALDGLIDFGKVLEKQTVNLSTGQFVNSAMTNNIRSLMSELQKTFKGTVDFTNKTVTEIVDELRKVDLSTVDSASLKKLASTNATSVLKAYNGLITKEQVRYDNILKEINKINTSEFIKDFKELNEKLDQARIALGSGDSVNDGVRGQIADLDKEIRKIGANDNTRSQINGFNKTSDIGALYAKSEQIIDDLKLKLNKDLKSLSKYITSGLGATDIKGYLNPNLSDNDLKDKFKEYANALKLLEQEKSDAIASLDLGGNARDYFFKDSIDKFKASGDIKDLRFTKKTSDTKAIKAKADAFLEQLEKVLDFKLPEVSANLDTVLAELGNTRTTFVPIAAQITALKTKLAQLKDQKIALSKTIKDTTSLDQEVKDIEAKIKALKAANKNEFSNPEKALANIAQLEADAAMALVQQATLTAQRDVLTRGLEGIFEVVNQAAMREFTGAIDIIKKNLASAVSAGLSLTERNIAFDQVKLAIDTLVTSADKTEDRLIKGIARKFTAVKDAINAFGAGANPQALKGLNSNMRQLLAAIENLGGDSNNYGIESRLELRNLFKAVYQEYEKAVVDVQGLVDDLVNDTKLNASKEVDEILTQLKADISGSDKSRTLDLVDAAARKLRKVNSGLGDGVARQLNSLTGIVGKAAQQLEIDASGNLVGNSSLARAKTTIAGVRSLDLQGPTSKLDATVQANALESMKNIVGTVESLLTTDLQSIKAGIQTELSTVLDSTSTDPTDAVKDVVTQLETLANKVADADTTLARALRSYANKLTNQSTSAKLDEAGNNLVSALRNFTGKTTETLNGEFLPRLRELTEIVTKLRQQRTDIPDAKKLEVVDIINEVVKPLKDLDTTDPAFNEEKAKTAMTAVGANAARLADRLIAIDTSLGNRLKTMGYLANGENPSLSSTAIAGLLQAGERYGGTFDSTIVGKAKTANSTKDRRNNGPAGITTEDITALSEIVTMLNALDTDISAEDFAKEVQAINTKIHSTSEEMQRYLTTIPRILERVRGILVDTKNADLSQLAREIRALENIRDSRSLLDSKPIVNLKEKLGTANAGAYGGLITGLVDTVDKTITTLQGNKASKSTTPVDKLKLLFDKITNFDIAGADLTGIKTFGDTLATDFNVLSEAFKGVDETLRTTIRNAASTISTNQGIKLPTSELKRLVAYVNRVAGVDIDIDDKALSNVGKINAKSRKFTASTNTAALTTDQVNDYLDKLITLLDTFKAEAAAGITVDPAKIRTLASNIRTETGNIFNGFSNSLEQMAYELEGALSTRNLDIIFKLLQRIESATIRARGQAAGPSQGDATKSGQASGKAAGIVPDIASEAIKLRESIKSELQTKINTAFTGITFDESKDAKTELSRIGQIFIDLVPDIEQIAPTISRRLASYGEELQNYSGDRNDSFSQRGNQIIQDLSKYLAMTPTAIKTLIDEFVKTTGALQQFGGKLRGEFKNNRTTEQRAAQELIDARNAVLMRELNRDPNISETYPEGFRNPATLSAYQTALTTENAARAAAGKAKFNETLEPEDLIKLTESRISRALQVGKKDNQLKELEGIAKSFGLGTNLENLAKIAESGIYMINKRIKQFGYQIFQETFSNMASLILFQLGKMFSDAYQEASEISKLSKVITASNLDDTGVLRKTKEVGETQKFLRDTISAAAFGFEGGSGAAIDYAKELNKLGVSAESVGKKIIQISNIARNSNRDLGDITKLAIEIDKLYGITNERVATDVLNKADANEVNAEKTQENFLALAGNQDIRGSFSYQDLTDAAIKYAIAGKDAAKTTSELVADLHAMEDITLEDQVRDIDELFKLGRIGISLGQATEAMYNSMMKNLQDSGLGVFIEGFVSGLQLITGQIQMVIAVMAELNRSSAKPFIEGALAIGGMVSAFVLVRTVAANAIPVLTAFTRQIAAAGITMGTTVTISQLLSRGVLTGLVPAATALTAALKFLMGPLGIAISTIGALWAAWRMYQNNLAKSREETERTTDVIDNLSASLSKLGTLSGDTDKDVIIKKLGLGVYDKTAKLVGEDLDEIKQKLKDLPKDNGFVSEAQQKALTDANQSLTMARDAAAQIKANLGELSGNFAGTSGPFAQMAQQMIVAKEAAIETAKVLSNIPKDIITPKALATAQLPSLQANVQSILAQSTALQSETSVYRADDEITANRNINSLAIEKQNLSNDNADLNAEITALRTQTDKALAFLDKGPKTADTLKQMAEIRDTANSRINTVTNTINANISRMNAIQQDITDNEETLASVQRSRVQGVMKILQKTADVLEPAERELVQAIINASEFRGQSVEQFMEIFRKDSSVQRRVQQITESAIKDPLRQPNQAKVFAQLVQLPDALKPKRTEVETPKTLDLSGYESKIREVLDNYGETYSYLVMSPEAKNIRKIINDLQTQLAAPGGIITKGDPEQALSNLKNLTASLKTTLQFMESTNKLIDDLQFIGAGNPVKGAQSKINAANTVLDPMLAQAAELSRNSELLATPEGRSQLKGLEGSITKITQTIVASYKQAISQMVQMTNSLATENEGIERKMRQRLRSASLVFIQDPIEKEYQQALIEADMQYEKEMADLKKLNDQALIYENFLNGLDDKMKPWLSSLDENTKALNDFKVNLDGVQNPNTPDSTKGAGDGYQGNTNISTPPSPTDFAGNDYSKYKKPAKTTKPEPEANDLDVAPILGIGPLKYRYGDLDKFKYLTPEEEAERARRAAAGNDDTTTRRLPIADIEKITAEFRAKIADLEKVITDLRAKVLANEAEITKLKKLIADIDAELEARKAGKVVPADAPDDDALRASRTWYNDLMTDELDQLRGFQAELEKAYKGLIDATKTVIADLPNVHADIMNRIKTNLTGVLNDFNTVLADGGEGVRTTLAGVREELAKMLALKPVGSTESTEQRPPRTPVNPNSASPEDLVDLTADNIEEAVRAGAESGSRTGTRTGISEADITVNVNNGTADSTRSGGASGTVRIENPSGNADVGRITLLGKPIVDIVNSESFVQARKLEGKTVEDLRKALETYKGLLTPMAARTSTLDAAIRVRMATVQTMIDSLVGTEDDLKATEAKLAGLRKDYDAARAASQSVINQQAERVRKTNLIFKGRFDPKDILTLAANDKVFDYVKDVLDNKGKDRVIPGDVKAILQSVAGDSDFGKALSRNNGGTLNFSDTTDTASYKALPTGANTTNRGIQDLDFKDMDARFNRLLRTRQRTARGTGTSGADFFDIADVGLSIAVLAQQANRTSDIEKNFITQDKTLRANNAGNTLVARINPSRGTISRDQTTGAYRPSVVYITSGVFGASDIGFKWYLDKAEYLVGDKAVFVKNPTEEPRLVTGGTDSTWKFTAVQPGRYMLSARSTKKVGKLTNQVLSGVKAEQTSDGYIELTAIVMIDPVALAVADTASGSNLTGYVQKGNDVYVNPALFGGGNVGTGYSTKVGTIKNGKFERAKGVSDTPIQDALDRYYEDAAKDGAKKNNAAFGLRTSTGGLNESLDRAALQNMDTFILTSIGGSNSVTDTNNYASTSNEPSLEDIVQEYASDPATQPTYAIGSKSKTLKSLRYKENGVTAEVTGEGAELFLPEGAEFDPSKLEQVKFFRIKVDLTPTLEGLKGGYFNNDNNPVDTQTQAGAATSPVTGSADNARVLNVKETKAEIERKRDLNKQDAALAKALANSTRIYERYMRVWLEIKGVLENTIKALLNIPKVILDKQKEQRQKINDMMNDAAVIRVRKSSTISDIDNIKSKMANAKTSEEYNSYLGQLESAEGQLRQLNEEMAVWEVGLQKVKKEGVDLRGVLGDIFDQMFTGISDIFTELAKDTVSSVLFNDPTKGIGNPFREKRRIDSASALADIGSVDEAGLWVPTFKGSDIADAMTQSDFDGLKTQAMSLKTPEEQQAAMKQIKILEDIQGNTKVTAKGMLENVAQGAATLLTQIAIQAVVTAAIAIFRQAFAKRETDSSLYSAPVSFDSTRGSSNPDSTAVGITVNVNGATKNEINNTVNKGIDQGMNKLRFGF